MLKRGLCIRRGGQLGLEGVFSSISENWLVHLMDMTAHSQLNLKVKE